MSNEQLDSLMTLARSKAYDAKSRLTQNITDLFLSDTDRLSEHERALMSDILAKLIVQVEGDVRAGLAKTMAEQAIDMPEVAKLLAADHIDIARPILEKTKLLQDPELIEIIRMRTDEHRLVIALRETVTAPVSDALIEHGSEDVIEALLHNKDAILSHQALEYLVSEAKRVDRFQEPLVGRSDLPTELAYRLYWWVTAALRKKILQNFPIDALTFENWVQAAAKSAPPPMRDQMGAYAQALRLIERMAAIGSLNLQFLINALRQHRFPVFVAGLAHLGGIDFRMAWRIFSEHGGESLAVLARAIGMERAQFASVFLLLQQARDGETAKSPGILQDILRLFDKIKPEQAKGALLIWQRDMAYQAAIDAVEVIGAVE